MLFEPFAARLFKTHVPSERQRVPCPEGCIGKSGCFSYIGASVHAGGEQDEEAPRAEVWRVLVELFSVSRTEMASLHVLRQRIQSQISTEEIIAVLKELEDDGYVMYRDEEGALDGPAVHRI